MVATQYLTDLQIYLSSEPLNKYNKFHFQKFFSEIELILSVDSLTNEYNVKVCNSMVVN